MSEIAMASQVGVTYINKKVSSFLWKIPEFSSLKLRFDHTISKCDWNGNIIGPLKGIIQSPEFSVDLEDLKWSLVLYRARYEQTTAQSTNSIFHNYVGFQLLSSNNTNLYLNTNVVLKILDGKTGNSIAKLEKSGPVNISDSPKELFKISSFRNADWTKYFISNHEVHVLCEYTFSDPKNDTTIKWSQDVKINRIIIESLKKQWENKIFCDFELIAPCGRKVSAHRCVLAAQSPVFDAMLTNDMIEKKNHSVKITDISYEALEVMLNFFYSGKIDKLDHKLVSDVLTAAEKYQVKDLKEGCQYFLSNTLSINNVIQTLELSKTFGMTDLEKLANDFVKSNAKEVLINNILQNNDDKDLIQQISLLLK